MNIYNQSCDLATTQTGRNKNFGWYKTHKSHEILEKRLHPLVLLIGDSIVAILRRYQTVWKKYFNLYKALDCGIPGDRNQHVLWRTEALSVLLSVKCVVVQCGSNNFYHDELKIIVNGIIMIGKVFQEKLAADVEIILTGLLPCDLNKSKRRIKILKVNSYFKKSCKDEINLYYLEKNRNWVNKDQSLDTLLCFRYYLHLIKPGNDKFVSKIVEMLTKLDCKNSPLTPSLSSKSISSLSSQPTPPLSLVSPSRSSPPSSLPL